MLVKKMKMYYKISINWIFKNRECNAKCENITKINKFEQQIHFCHKNYTGNAPKKAKSLQKKISRVSFFGQKNYFNFKICIIVQKMNNLELVYNAKHKSASKIHPKRPIMSQKTYKFFRSFDVKRQSSFKNIIFIQKISRKFSNFSIF